MATNSSKKKSPGAENDDETHTRYSPPISGHPPGFGEKRKSTEDGELEPSLKKNTPGVVKKTGISISVIKKAGPAISAAPLKMTLSSQTVKETTALKKPGKKVAAVFNEDSDSEEEEMPPEARMKMRNIGRETPTAAGPNSFGKGKLGFCDRQRMIQNELQKEIEKTENKK